MNGDKLIRFVATLAVLAVAGIAAVVSFNHVEHLALVNGQSLVAARLLPASVDGAILAASMVMLDSARRDVHTPVLARIMLVAAILATLAANSAAGAAHGVIGIMVSAWPAVAFIGSAELLMTMVRVRSQAAPVGLPEAAAAKPLSDSGPEVPGHSQVATVPTRRRSRAQGVITPEQIFAQELAAGWLPGVREVKRRCHVGQDAAAVIKSELAAFLSAPSDTIEATA